MSLISSVGNAASGLFGFLQQLSTNQQSSTAPATSATTNTTDTGGDGGSSVGQAHGHHHMGSSAVFQKIEAAVTSALQSASTSTTGAAGGTTDINQVIKQAITSVLNNAANGTETADSSTPTNDTQETGSTQDGFFQLLQANGVDAKQFQTDFQSALQDAQNNGVDLAKIFQGVPPGALVDETA